MIETQTDVKHILKSLEDGSATMKELDSRVDVLETAETNRQESKKVMKSIFNSRVTVTSLLIGASGVIVAIVAIFWPNKGAP